MEGLGRLIEIIEEIAKGNYSNDIMALTADDQPEHIRAIAEAMGMMMVKVEAREYQLEMLIEQLKELNEKIKENTIRVVSAMAHALAARDEYTEGHAARVGDLALRMARNMGMEGEDTRFVHIGGILHDIGKIGFPDHLFQPHEKKNSPEMVREIIKHPAVGAGILNDLDFLGPALEFVHCHHERPDGKGYPRRLHNGEIPLGAKLLAVADAYDAMTTDRPYQKGKTPAVALDILKKYAGEKWDPACVQALDAVLKETGLVE